MDASGFARSIFTIACALLFVGMSHTARADPARWTREGWTNTDFSKSVIICRDVVSGDPPKEGTPSIDGPIFEPAAKDQELTPNGPVIGLEIDGDARAYPPRIL